MNYQTGPHRIEWCDYTWNPTAGCLHGCQWLMPDGATAECYAKDIAERAPASQWPNGWAAHYWRPKTLFDPMTVKQPMKIFIGSMADLFGQWVPADQIEQVLTVCRKAHWHTFIILTKNAPRLLSFDFPPNVWVGVSAPPSVFRGHTLSLHQQESYVHKALAVLKSSSARITWMSVEPLSFDIAPHLVKNGLSWAVIGAASHGRTAYQPQPFWVERLLTVFDNEGVPVFFKGNLQWSPRREEFPVIHYIEQGRLF